MQAFTFSPSLTLSHEAERGEEVGLGLEVGVSLFENEAQDDVLVPLEGTPLDLA